MLFVFVLISAATEQKSGKFKMRLILHNFSHFGHYVEYNQHTNDLFFIAVSLFFFIGKTQNLQH